MFAFSSASQHNLGAMLTSGKDMEDSIFYMTAPAVANVPPNVWLNNLYVKYKFECVRWRGAACTDLLSFMRVI